MHCTAAILTELSLHIGLRFKNPGKGQSIRFVSFPEHLKPSAMTGLEGNWKTDRARTSSTGKIQNQHFQIIL